MRISLAYGWLFILLLILINIFQINFLLPILSLNLASPNPNSWFCHYYQLLYHSTFVNYNNKNKNKGLDQYLLIAP